MKRGNKIKTETSSLTVIFRLAALILLAAITAFASACIQPGSKLNDTEAVYAYMLEHGDFPKLVSVDEETASEIYGIDTGRLASYRFGISEDRLLAAEAAVFELSDEAYADDLIRILKANIEGAARSAKNYSPEQYALLTKATVAHTGRFVYYAVSEASEKLMKELSGLIAGGGH